MTGVSKKTAREFCLTWSAGRLLFFHPVFRNSFQEKEREKMNTEREKMNTAIDILQTRTGFKPTLVLVVPISRSDGGDIHVRRRCTIPDEEYNAKFLSPMGGRIQPSLPEVFIPVEQRFESALLDFDQLRRKYPIYAELIHHKLRFSVFECPNGWYDLLLPIAHDYALRNTDSQNNLECAMDAWHAWWRQYSGGGGTPAGLVPAIESTLRTLDLYICKRNERCG